jgi:aminoglycoside phosphotransferase (APT) family kinase protein
MLSPADRAVCERDPALPGLPLLLHAPALAAVLGLGKLEHAYLRYKPGTSCAAGFLHADRGALAAYAYPPDRYAEVRRRPEWGGEDDVVMLDESCIAVIPARLDRELKALNRFCDAERRSKFLRRLIGRRGGVWEGDHALLRYKPGRRLVARLDVDGRPKAALKVTGPEDYNQSLIGAAGAAALGGAPLIGADAGHCALATAWIAGEPLCPVATGRPPSRLAVARTGSALAALHAAAFRPAARTTRADEAAALGEVEPALTALDRVLGVEAGLLAGAISRRLGPAQCAETLVHGDFSADQVVLAHERPVILDWDHAASGDPARDVGTFLARFDAQVSDGVLTPAEAEEAGAALAEGYGAAAGRLPEGIALQHARALLMLATEGFRIRHPNWPTRTAALLERAAALLARRHRRPTDPAMPTLDAALDPGAVRPRLAAALGHEPGDVRMAEARLLRHKPGRRAVVRYDLIEPDGACRVLLGKLRAKGLDRRTPALHDALQAAGLDGRGQRGVGVPRAAGSIEALGLWLQELVPGRPLGDLLEPDADPAPFVGTGAALARLHRCGPASERRWTFADELSVLERALAQAADARPDAASALRAITRGASARIAGLGEGPAFGIHRDFYFDQVIVDGDRIWIVDLDLYALGDPAIDIGNFLAHLDELGVRRRGEPAAFAPQEAAFLDGYAGAGDLPNAARIATLRAVSLARHIHLSMRFAERRHTTERLIELSAAALSEPESTAP